MAHEKERELLVKFKEHYNKQYKSPILFVDIDLFLSTLPEEKYDIFGAEEFLQSKDIFNHPRITDRSEKNSYDVAMLMTEFANALPEEKEESLVSKLDEWIKNCLRMKSDAPASRCCFVTSLILTHLRLSSV